MDDRYNPDIELDTETFNKLNAQYKAEKHKYEVEVSRLEQIISEQNNVSLDLMEPINKMFETPFLETTDETYGYRIVADEFVQQVVEKIVTHADGSFDYYINLTGANHQTYKNKFDKNYSNRYLLPANATYVDSIEISYDDAQAFVKSFKAKGFYKKDWKPLIARIFITI